MKWQMLGLMLISHFTWATPVSDFVANFPNLNELHKAEQSYDLCNGLLKQWRSPNYNQSIQEMGSLWTAQPEGAYYLLSTCQTLCSSRYLSPLQVAQAQASQNQSRLAYLLAGADFIQAYKYLRQEIRLEKIVSAAQVHAVPQCPYQILDSMASTEQEMDESLQYEMRKSFAALAMTAGSLGVSLTIAKDMTSAVTSKSLAVGRAAKQALIITLFAAAAGGAVDNGLWYYRESDLSKRLGEATQKLLQPNPSTPLPLLLDDFYSASQKLGYFYSYSLYLSESGVEGVTPEINPKCADQLDQYFSGKYVSFGLSRALLERSLCADAALVWLAAAQFLSEHFPQNAQAALVAARLAVHARRTYLSYQQTKAAEKTMAKCNPTFLNGNFGWSCVDPVTGGEVI